MENVKIHRIPLGVYRTNCYVVENINTGNSIIVDCGDGEEFKKYVESNCLSFRIKYGLITHGHFDHVGGVKFIQENYDTMFFIGLKDMEAQHEEPYLFPRLKGVNVVYDNLVLNFEDFKITTIATPGHTMGGMTYKFENHIFTGDTLFKGTVGRVDLYGGDFEILMNSIKEKLFILPKDTIIHPGHGEESTIENEINDNEFVI